MRIVFDLDRLSYEELLGYFFRLHDPTALNRQGNDVGTPYRSAIFYENEARRRVAEAVKAKVETSGKRKRPLTTEIVPASEFWLAEEYHQDYLQKTLAATAATSSGTECGERNFRSRTARRSTGFAPPLSTFASERSPVGGLTTGVRRRTRFPQPGPQTKS